MNRLSSRKYLDGARKRAPNGDPRRFIEEHVSHTGDECLIWPYARFKNGYAEIGTSVASNVMCEAAHGPAPDGKTDAAHSCGNGTLGCVNPNHLSWKTRKENMADTLAHGTRQRGEKHGAAKLTPALILYIRGSAKRGVDLAAELGISKSHISGVRSGTKWGWLK